MQVCQSYHSLSLYDINNHKEDTIAEDTKPNSITYFNQSEWHTPFDGGKVCVHIPHTHCRVIFCRFGYGVKKLRKNILFNFKFT